MKNAKVILLSALVVLIVGITGVFIGRNTPDNRTRLPSSTVQTAVSTAQNTLQTDTPKTAATEAALAESGDGKININTATKEQLTLLPGIGETLADRIIAYRQENGAFTNTAQLELVEGIGNKKLLAILDYITVGG